MPQTTTPREITPQSTMAEVLLTYPAAQRALFAKYHIGGCGDCGFTADQTLEEVLKAKNVLDAQEAITLIKAAQKAETDLQISPKEFQALQKEGGFKLLDVRDEFEHGMVNLDGDVLATPELIDEMLNKWPKDTRIVVYCHTGRRSFDAAQYLAGHGFTWVKSLQGGIDAWSQEIDPLLPRY